jgi:hypothetical protein
LPALKTNPQILTREEAKAYVKNNPAKTTWNAVPANKKQELLALVNAQLADQGVPPIREDVWKWRMAQAIPNASRGKRLVTWVWGKRANHW